MKKLLWLLAFVFVFFLVFIFYLQRDTTVFSDTASIESQNSDVIHLRFGHNTPKESGLHEASLRFADIVKEKSGGKLIVDIYPAQQLGNDHQMVEMARQGELDIILTPTAKMSVAVPSMQYADLPFYFPSRQDLYDMLDGEPGQMILDELRSIGLIGVTFWENGFKHLSANTPILSPEDLKEKKIRVMKSRIIMEQFTALGAKPVAIDFHATKKALSDGVVDGQENPLVAFVSMGFHKVQSDLTLSEHAFLGYVFSLSEKSIAPLPNNLKSILIESAKEVTPWERFETQKREQKFLHIAQEAGVRIHRLTKEQRQEFVKLLKHIPEQFEDVIGVNVISKTKELLYKKYGGFLKNEPHLLLGINSDASLDGKSAALEIKRGVALAVAEINAAGGILGLPVDVVLKDHKVASSRGIKNMQEFAQNSQLLGVIGGKHSAVIIEDLSVAQKEKIPYLIPWAAAHRIVKNGFDQNYIFRVSANDALVSEFMAKQILRKNRPSAILVENSVWGREYLESIKKYMHKHGKRFTKKIVFNRGQKDFSHEIESVVASGAESIILLANTQEGNQVLKALSKQEKSLDVISHWGIVTDDFFEKNKNILSKINLEIFQTFSFRTQKNRAAQKLLEAYEKRYKSSFRGIDHAVAHAYDVTKMLALAVERAGSLDREEIKKSLESLEEYDGVLKHYKYPFNKSHHDALGEESYYMAKFNADGILVPIKDE